MKVVKVKYAHRMVLYESYDKTDTQNKDSADEMGSQDTKSADETRTQDDFK